MMRSVQKALRFGEAGPWPVVDNTPVIRGEGSGEVHHGTGTGVGDGAIFVGSDLSAIDGGA